MPGTEFRFEPPNRRHIWKELALTMSQAAALTGVSERQIQHWMDKGYIQPTASGARKIGGESLDAIMLIKQARSAGIPLRRAVPLAYAYLAREASSVLESDMARWAVHDLQDRLSAAQAGIESVQAMLQATGTADGRRRESGLPALKGDHV
jgi:DNA-binding transcriptional MerR regulator